LAICAAGTYDPDDFDAILSGCVCHKQQQAAVFGHSDSPPALLSILEAIVRLAETARVIKHGCRLVKMDAVLAPVRLFFFIVPFKLPHKTNVSQSRGCWLATDRMVYTLEECSARLWVPNPQLITGY
jgi:hypothetical protein